MKKRTLRWLSSLLIFAVTVGSAGALPADIAYAQSHSHRAGVSLDRQELVEGISHSLVLASIVFLVGLTTFAALVWLPVSWRSRVGQEGAILFGHWGWGLLGLLVAAGVVEVSAFAVSASGESFSLGLFAEALFDTRVGNIWLVRLVLACAVVLLAVWASRQEKFHLWWIAAGLGSVLLLTLTQLSHSAAEGRFLPFLADWLHVIAATFWMGGLLGFPILLLGPLCSATPETRAKLLDCTVRRFTRIATAAVLVLLVTGSYMILVHTPSLLALVEAPYGRALLMKLSFVALMLPIGLINLLDSDRESFSSMVVLELILAFGVFTATGFLTSLPPP